METGLVGTSVATETCGQVRPLKLRNTFWSTGSGSTVTVIVRGVGDRRSGGFTRNSGTGCPAAPVSARDGQRRLARLEDRHDDRVLDGLDPERRLHLHGLRRSGALAAGLPSRKAMLSVPPPNSGAAGLVEMTMVVVR